MYFASDTVLLQDFISKVLPALVGSREIPGMTLLFGPFKIAFFIGWVYLCMFCVQGIELGSLIPDKYKPIANIFALVAGPLILFVLVVVDITKKLQNGDIGPEDILGEIFGGWLKKSYKGKPAKTKKIELMDSSGKSFQEVYGGQSRDKQASRETLNLTEKIIFNAIRDRASDILIDPKSDSVYMLRYRVDGFLRLISQIEGDKCVAVVNSIKAISGMDIAEKRRPQDGSFMAKVEEGNIYFRVATAGVLGGEKITIRVLNQHTGLLKLEEIGLVGDAYSALENAIKQPSGMVMICGPTGSGKTTTLYAMLGMIDFFTRNVITVEDPVEYMLPQTSQIEVNVKANITFANSLRSILRQDPDVICVGEIRDAETAAMALQSSQTGHLVLATLHSSSNLSTLVRLLDLGIKPLLLSSALSMIVSQRLVRKLCEKCKTPAELSDKQIADFRKRGIDVSKIMMAKGCKKCSDTGFVGRTALMDVLVLDDRIKAILADDKLSPGDLKKRGDEKGRSTLRKEGIKKVLAGITTLDEVKRVTSNLG